MSAAPLAYVISPQTWAGFHVSKHHYAVALADRGWRVIFVDPPTHLGRAGAIELMPTEVPGITSLRYQTFFPYNVKFRLRWAFDALMRRQARLLLQQAGQPELVWDFDNAYQFRDLRVFGAQKTLFHLVDDVGNPDLGDKKADHFFYLHPSFCTRAGGTLLPENEVGHGLGKLHSKLAQRHADSPPANKDRPPHIGFVGNLGTPWLDWDEIARMVERHPSARFTFWGPLPAKEATNPVLSKLLSFPCVSFPGLKRPEDILSNAEEIDIWLVPFVTEKFPGGALNSHKILEYLSTGRTVVMNWLEAYDGNPLVEMLPTRDSTGLADLLDEALANLDSLNAPEMMARRRKFALDRTYDRHMEYIMSIIEPTLPASCNAA